MLLPRSMDCITRTTSPPAQNAFPFPYIEMKSQIKQDHFEMIIVWNQVNELVSWPWIVLFTQEANSFSL